jgi:tRNA nucleotidyltransferase (CCA-adding enzyme)
MLAFEELELPPFELHEGPYVDSEAAENFLRKYMNDPNVVGPFIRGSRWYVIRNRKIPSAVDAIKHLLRIVSLKDLRDSVNHAEYIIIKSLDDLNILNPRERGVVEEFLYARPWWLA